MLARGIVSVDWVRLDTEFYYMYCMKSEAASSDLVGLNFDSRLGNSGLASKSSFFVSIMMFVLSPMNSSLTLELSFDYP